MPSFAARASGGSANYQLIEQLDFVPNNFFSEIGAFIIHSEN
jgi:hypothetical protein